MDEELSLRDIADILGQYKALLIGLPLFLAVTAFVVAKVTPASYTSSAVVTLSNKTLNAGATNLASAISLDPTLLPSASALTQAYQVAAPRRLANVWKAEPQFVQQAFSARFEEKSNAITLSAQGNSPAGAQRRAQLASNDFVQYANSVVTKVISETYQARLQQARSEIQGNELVLRNLRRSLASTPPVLTGRGQPSGRASADAAGLDARFAGNSDQPANPAYSYLAVKVAQVEADLADNTALATRLESSLRSPEQLLSLARQTTQISTLAEANLPTQRSGVSPAVVTVLAFLLGLFVAVIAAFVMHALRRPVLHGSSRSLAP